MDQNAEATDSNEQIASTAMLKDKIISVCEELSKLGEESAFLSVNTSSELAFSTGSLIGRSFLQQQPDMMDLFYKYCKFRYTCPDNTGLLLPNDIKQENPNNNRDLVLTKNEEMEDTILSPISANKADNGMFHTEHRVIGSDSTVGEKALQRNPKEMRQNQYIPDNCSNNNYDSVPNLENASENSHREEISSASHFPNKNRYVQLTPETDQLAPTKTAGLCKNPTPDNRPGVSWEVPISNRNVNEDYNNPVRKKQGEKRSTMNKRATSKRSQKEVKCCVCSKSFYNAKKLTMHMKLHDQKESYRCNVCNITIFNMESFRIHMKVHQGKKPVKSGEGQVCQGQGDSSLLHGKSSQENHSKDNSDIKVQSDYANSRDNHEKEIIKNKQSPKKGKIIYTKLVQMTAKELGFSGGSVKKIQNPQKSNNSVDETSEIKNRMSNNIVNWEKNDEVNDSDSIEKSREDKTLPITKECKTAKSPKEYECKICSQYLKNFKMLNIHMKGHEGKQIFECDVCGKLLTSKISLNRHKSLHSGNKSYKCNICEKSYNFPGNLSVHMKKHTEELQFKCMNCFEAFGSKTLLNRHWERVCGKFDLLDSSDNNDGILIANEFTSPENQKKKRGRKRKSENGETIKSSKDQDLVQTKQKKKGKMLGNVDKSLNNDNEGSDMQKYSENDITCISSDEDDEINELLVENQNESDEKDEPEEAKNTKSPRKQIVSMETLFKCDICGKVFIDRPSLAIHNQKHMTEKDYKCEECGRGFIHEHNLNVHRKIHSQSQYESPSSQE